MIDKTTIVLSAISLMVVTEVVSAVIRKYFPERRGHLAALFLQVPAWILSAWGLVFVLTFKSTVNEFGGAVMTLTSLIILAAMYGVAGGGFLSAMAINYSKVPSGRDKALRLIGLATLSVVLGLLPFLLSIFL